MASGQQCKTTTVWRDVDIDADGITLKGLNVLPKPNESDRFAPRDCVGEVPESYEEVETLPRLVVQVWTRAHEVGIHGDTD
jgi:hypothetical protein